jgi:hypothetical protein
VSSRKSVALDQSEAIVGRDAAIMEEAIISIVQSIGSLSEPELRAALKACRLVRRRNRVSSVVTTAFFAGFIVLQLGFAFVIFGAVTKLLDTLVPPAATFFGSMAFFFTTFWLLASNPRLNRVWKDFEAERNAWRDRLDLLDDTIALLRDRLADSPAFPWLGRTLPRPTPQSILVALLVVLGWTEFLLTVGLPLVGALWLLGGTALCLFLWRWFRRTR